MPLIVSEKIVRQNSAAKRQKNKAHGASRGKSIVQQNISPEGGVRSWLTQPRTSSSISSSVRANRLPLIKTDIAPDLHAYLGGIVREIGGCAICVSGTTDHVHLLVRMPSTHSLADVARLIKTNSSRWVHQRWPQFPNFAWQTGYGAFSVSESGIESVRAYILGQQRHHSKRSFQEEFVAFLKKNRIAINEQYLWT